MICKRFTELYKNESFNWLFLTRKIKRDIIFVQYCISFYTTSQFKKIIMLNIIQGNEYTNNAFVNADIT